MVVVSKQCEDVQVNVAQLGGSRKTLLESLLGRLVRAKGRHGDLAGVENLGSVNAGLVNGLCAFGFILVVFGTVDLYGSNELAKVTKGQKSAETYVAVSDFQRLQSGFLGDIRRTVALSVSQFPISQTKELNDSEATYVW